MAVLSDLRTTGVSHVYAHHVLATGAVDPAWPADGRALTDRTSSEEDPRLVPDGSGGVVVVWQGPGNGFIDIYAHHVMGAGVVDPTWPFGGALVRRSRTGHDPEIETDGAGGVVVAWNEDAGIAAQHVLADGTFDPAYPDTGRTITLLPTLGPAGLVATTAGGAIVGWSDARSSGTGLDVYAMQVLAVEIPTAISVVLQDVQAEVGAVRLRWVVPDARSTACTVQRRSAVSDWADLGLADAESGTFVRYEDRSVAPGERYAYRLFVQSARDQGYSNEVWILVPSGAGAPLALRLDPVYPNPFQTQTTLNFGIPAAAAVRLGIYSVSGRRVATVIDRNLPAGWRSATWDGRDSSGRPVASGSYFARLESAGRVEIRKIVVAR